MKSTGPKHCHCAIEFQVDNNFMINIMLCLENSHSSVLSAERVNERQNEIDIFESIVKESVRMCRCSYMMPVVEYGLEPLCNGYIISLFFKFRLTNHFEFWASETS